MKDEVSASSFFVLKNNSFPILFTIIFVCFLKIEDIAKLKYCDVHTFLSNEAITHPMNSDNMLRV